jgi:hypothetical protein
MNALAKTDTNTHGTIVTSNPMAPRSMNDAIRLAELMCQGKMVPQHLQNSPGDCLMVIEQAMRWNMSPFAVAQCTSSIKGKLMFEGKLVAAAVENSGAIVGLMDYVFSKAGNERTITVSAIRRGESEPRTVDVALKDVVTDNGMWKKQPDQQLVYSGARVWARRWTPGVMLGVYTPEEFNTDHDIGHEAPREQPRELTAVTIAAPSEKTQQTVDALINQIASCEAPEEWLDRDGKSAKYREKLKGAHPELSAQLEAAFTEARERLFPEPDTAENTLPGTDPQTPTLITELLTEIEPLSQKEVDMWRKNAAFAARLKKLSPNELARFEAVVKELVPV